MGKIDLTLAAELFAPSDSLELIQHCRPRYFESIIRIDLQATATEDDQLASNLLRRRLPPLKTTNSLRIY